MRRRILPLLTLFLAASLSAQEAPLPVDPDVRVGQLDNGLRYWIRENSEPANRLHLRLIVRAGSILEEEDQLGLAHFLEHMAFNGTTRFAKNDLIDALQSIGVRFGADLNAFTSFDETTYVLPVPSDKPELVTLAFDVLQDWAGGVLLDSIEVVNERGVVMGEWRSGLGAQSRVRDREFPVLFQGSRYAERLPIGDTAIIAHADPDPLRRFYHDWYRPNLMAIVAVGDFPADSLEELIRSRFGGLTNPANAPERYLVPIPEQPGVRFSSVTDEELTSESVQYLVRRPSEDYLTVADERLSLVESLVTQIVTERMVTVSRDADSPFVVASFGPSRLIGDARVFALQATAKDGLLAESFEATLTELRRLIVYGVLAEELERAKANLLRGRESAALEADDTPSAALVNRYVNAFVRGSVPVSSTELFRLAGELLPTISLDEVEAKARQMAQGTDRFIALRAPAREGQSLPTETEMLAILERVENSVVEPWVEATTDGPLVASPPTPGQVVATVEHPEVGVTEWTLSNGIRVLVKSTDFKADEIVFGGFRFGGSSLLGPEAAFQAGFGSAAIAQSGLGRFDPPALQKRLAGTVSLVSPGLAETEESFSGRSAPDDLETLFQLLWLNAMEPRFDSAAVAVFLDRIRPFIANAERDPSTAFQNAMTLVVGQGSPRQDPMTMAKFESLDPRRGYDLFKSRFADFTGFTFVFVGNVDLDALRPLVEQWLGGLPANGEASTWVDVAPPFLPDTSTTTVNKGQEPVSTTAVIFNGPASATDVTARLEASMAASVLQTRLLEKLREAMGGTYGAQAGGSISSVPRPAYRGSIFFTSTPEMADEMWLATRTTVEELQREGPTEEELANAMEQQRRVTEQQFEANGAWASMLLGRVRSGESFESLLQWEDRLDALTREAVREAAVELFDLSRMARVVLKPEV